MNPEEQEDAFYVVMISVGAHRWTKLTVMAYLSFQARLQEDIPKYKTLLITDKPRQFKAYFSNWVEIIALDPQKVQERYPEPSKMKYQVLYDLMQQRPNGHFLYLDSDTYFQRSGLVGLNALAKGEHVLGGNAQQPDPGIMGIPKGKEQTLLKWRDGRFDASEPLLHFEDFYHYGKEMEAKWPQVARFFDSHYYREMGELFTLVSLFTPDKWHLPPNEWPEELL